MTLEPRVYIAGMAGAAAMSLLSAAGRRADVNVDLERMMGAQVADPRRRRTWLLGLMGQLAIGGVLAQLYRIGFERLDVAPSPIAGAAMGLVHGSFAGAALAAAPAVHPRIPELIAPPGAFMLGYGRREAALFLAIHVVFGAIVASAIDLHASNRRPLNRPETP